MAVKKLTRKELSEFLPSERAIRAFERLLNDNDGVVLAELTDNTAILIRSSATLSDSAGSNTATLTNAPVAGNPSKWIEIDDNGTTRKIPAW